MKLALFLILFGLGIACAIYFGLSVRKILKDHRPNEEHYKIDEKQRGFLLSLVGVQMLLCIGSSITFVNYLEYAASVLEYVALVCGSIVLAASFDGAMGAFMLYYYKTDLDEKQRKICKYVKVIGVITALIGMWIFTEGFARCESIYPLISGVGTTTGWVYGGERVQGLGFKFYGLLIVSGAVLVYLYVDHTCYKKFKKHGIVDSLFIVAFLGGIIGARLWSCYVLEPETYIGNFPAVFRITDGGLAIMGGALGGIGIGVAFMLIFRKYIDVRWMMDVVVPAILIAQIIGRWGNFFNQEVYGLVVEYKDLWYLPTIVKNNMFIDGAYRMPLFLIEGVINLFGYFFIRHLFGKVFKLPFGLGYQCGAYITWYGAVRACLEPLRRGFENTSNGAGDSGYMQSWITAFVMIGLGLLIILGLYIVHKIRMNKGLEDKYGEKI